MKNKRLLVPGFLNKLDRYLLLNKPDTWSARTHLVFYYGLLFAFALTAICFLIPNDPRQNSNVFSWSFFVAMLSGIGFIIWLIYLLRFNVFKRFGVVSKGDNVKTFLLYSLSIGTMVAVAFIPSVVESIRANNTYSSAELVQDINKMNIDICRLNYDSIPHRWDTDTFLMKNKKESSYQKVEVEEYDDAEGDVVVATASTNNFHEIDKADFEFKKESADSSKLLNDSMLVVYDCPDYNFVNSYYANYAVRNKILSSAAIYNKFLKAGTFPDKAQLNKELEATLRKYAPLFIVYYAERREGYRQRMSSKYGLYSVNESVGNIMKRKFRWNESTLQICARVFYYITLVLSLLVFIFRRSTVKTFFLSILTCIVLLILTSLVLVFVQSGDILPFVCCVVLYFVFLVFAISVFYNKKRMAASGIGLNLTVFFTVFVPLIVTAMYYSILRYTERIREQYSFKKFENENLHYFLAEVIGFVLLLVLIETVFKKLYRRWYALPEQ